MIKSERARKSPVFDDEAAVATVMQDDVTGIDPEMANAGINFTYCDSIATFVSS